MATTVLPVVFTKFMREQAMNKDFPANVRLFYDESRGAEARSLAHSLLAEGMPADATEIYRARNLVVITADGRYCIKSYKVPGFAKGCMYGMFRTPKARRAWQNAVELEKAGIATPAPVLALEVRHAGLLGASYFVSDALDAWETLRGVEKRPDFPALARALAAFMLQLHEKGIFMRDFTPGNVLFKQNGGGYLFCLVDINRMSFGVRDKKVLLKNFGSPLDTREGVVLLAKEFARQSASEADESLAVERMAMECYDARQNFLKRKRSLKRLFKRKK